MDEPGSPGPGELLDGNGRKPGDQFGFRLEPVPLRRSADKTACLGAKIGRSGDPLLPFRRAHCRPGGFEGDGFPGLGRSDIRCFGNGCFRNFCGRCLADAGAGFSGLGACHDLSPFWRQCDGVCLLLQISPYRSVYAKSGPSSKRPPRHPECSTRVVFRPPDPESTFERPPVMHSFGQGIRPGASGVCTVPGDRSTRCGRNDRGKPSTGPIVDSRTSAAACPVRRSHPGP
jgi:hypothetical protein